MSVRVAKILRPVAAMPVLERVRAMLTVLNLHLAGVALLAIANLYLLVHMGFAWQAAHSQDAEALAQQRVQLKLAQIAALPLRGRCPCRTRRAAAAEREPPRTAARPQ